MNQRHRDGFTIMELLIASALASILMVGILFATTQQARQVQRQQKRTSPTELDALVQLLRSDLMLAQACRIKDDQIHLQGYFKRDPKTQVQTQQPAQVIYRLVEIGKETWLIRHQRDPKSLTLQDSTANLVCKGITSMQLFSIETPTDTATPQSDATDDAALPVQTDAPAEPQPFTDQWQTVPAVVQWIITRSQTDQPNNFDIQEQDANALTFTLVLR
ncbi:MAG: prepilin-type N-terminal cleavage/methylation domain-containing protein [Phycisphaeraceae bacterium JB051]